MAGPGGAERGRISIRVLPSTDAFARSLKRYLERIERTTRLDIGLGLDQSDLRETEARIAELARDRRATIELDVDQSALDRIRTAVAGLGRSGSGGGFGGGSDGLFGSRQSRRILLLATAITALAPAVVGLTGALLQASGALALIPALGLAGAAGLGVLALAFTNLGAAGAEFDHIKREIGFLKDEFAGLQQSVQAKFFADLAHPLRDLATSILPILQERLTGIASAFNEVSRASIDFLSTAQSLADTNLGLQNTEATIRNLVPGIVGFAAAFRDIAAVGSTFLPGLATGLSNAGEQFAAFIAGARDSGALADFFERSFDAVESLSASIWNLVSAAGGLIKAQGDTAGFLQNLYLVTDAIDRVFNSAGGQAGFGALFSGISAGMAALFGNLDTMESLLASIGSVIGALFENVGRVGGALLTALAPALAVLSPLLVQFLDLVGAELSGVLVALTPVLETVAGSLGSALLGAFQALIPVVAGFLVQMLPVIEALGVALADALVQLTPYIAEVATALADALIPAFTELIPQIPGLAQNFADLLIATAPLIPSLLALAGEVLRAIPLIIRLANDVLPPLIAEIGAWADMLTVVIGWLTSAGKALNDFANTFGTAGGQVQFMIALLGFAFTAMRAQVDRNIDGVTSTVRELPGKVTDALSGFGTLLWDKGRALIQGLIDGIRSMLGAVGSAMGAIASKAAEYLPGSPVKTGPLRSWNNGGAGKRLVDMLASGLNDTTAVDRAMASLTSRIAAPNLTAGLGFNGASASAGATMNVYPQQGQSEYEIASIASRQLAFGMRS